MKVFLAQTSLVAGLLATLTAAARLTPERLITAPRAGSATTAPNGLLAVIGTSQYSLETKSTDKLLHLVHIPASSRDRRAPLIPLVHNATSGFFLSNGEAAYTVGDDLFYKDIATSPESDPNEHGTLIGTFPAPVDNIQVVISNDASTATLVFSAPVYDDGDLAKVRDHDKSVEEQQWENNVRIYDELRVREWDVWLKPNRRSQLFSVDLKRNRDNRWEFAGEFRNLLKGTKLETPVYPFGGSDDFTCNSRWVAFTAKDSELPNAWHTKQNVYLVPLKGGKEPVKITKGDHGITGSPAFNREGTKIAWWQMARDGYESDRRQIILYDLPKKIEADDAGERTFLSKDWDRSPSKLQFSHDGSKLLALAEEEEHEKLFSFDLASAKAAKGGDLAVESEALIEDIGVSAFQTLPDGRNLFTASTLQTITELGLHERGSGDEKNPSGNGSYWTSADPAPSGPIRKLTTFGAALEDVEFGPKPEQFSYSGSGGRPSYGWIHFPPGYDPKAKHSYALKVLIHGGPEGCWSNSWSSRWNPEAFAASTPEGDADGKGSIVVTIDPAGSTSFGQAYTEEILGNWGGAPFHDIIAGVHYAAKVWDTIDKKRITAAGASYGGYMANWIQGHNNDGLFKAIVNHDGVFDTATTW